MKEEKITWRSFWNGGSDERPDLHEVERPRLADALRDRHKGVIRHKNLRGEAMEKAVEELLKEAEKAKEISGS